MQNSQKFSLFLLVSVLLGAALGVLLGPKAESLKPFGDLFLNLLFTAVVPLVFFSIASAACRIQSVREFGQITGAMLTVFIITGIIASFLMVFAVFLFPPTISETITLKTPELTGERSFFEAIQQSLTVSDFPNLFSKNNMLALIIFSLLVGIATSTAKEKGEPFAAFLISGNEVMLKIIGLIMYYAPIGLASYFAHLTGVFGPELLGPYAHAIALYYPVALIYFFVAFSIYAWLAGGRDSFQKFWGNILPVSLTALGTGSSVAAIPSNLVAADRANVPRKISEIVIPLGATLHMDGSCLSAILKIALLFGFYDMPFGSMETILPAIGIALIAGSVMSGVPGGGFIGEVMIVSFYGFPPEALAMITTLGMLVDPPATMVNAAGDNVASMLVARFLGKSPRSIPSSV